MKNDLNIYILNTIFSGTESINVLKEQIPIKGVIGLNSNFDDKNIISGFDNMRDYCSKNSLVFTGVNTYNLKSEADKSKLLNLKIDILLVLGWQRLIPQWLIDNVKIACIGAHGSPWGIEKGRGRSPINWALLAGKDNFVIDIFNINSGIDEGEVIDEQEFSISQFDDVNSIYYKVSWCIAQMIIKNINNGNIINKIYNKQNHVQARYLPKRIPDDGEIDWNRSNIEIYNFVRALTKPYPGAFSYLDNNKIFVWSAIPFDDMYGFQKYEPGEIIKYYTMNDEFLVKCKNGAILVKDYSGEINTSNALEHKKFISTNFKEQMQKIIERHYLDYKNNICNDEIEKLQW